MVGHGGGCKKDEEEKPKKDKTENG